MSMERMFEDLEGRFAHLEAEEMRIGAEEMTRAERARITLADRLRGALGRPLVLHLGTDHAVAGPLAALGADWVLLGQDESSGPRMLVPLAGIVMIEGLPARARPDGGGVLGPRSLAAMLREIAEERGDVLVHTTLGASRGRLLGIGEDLLDLVRLSVDDARGRRRMETVSIPLARLRCLAVL